MESDKELQELLGEIDGFAKAMKQRLIKESFEGAEGWKKVSLENAAYKINTISTELNFNRNKDIAIANWCLIHWINRKK